MFLKKIVENTYILVKLSAITLVFFPCVPVMQIFNTTVTQYIKKYSHYTVLYLIYCINYSSGTHILHILGIVHHIYSTLPATLLPETFSNKAVIPPSHDLYILLICSETSWMQIILAVHISTLLTVWILISLHAPL